MPADLELPMTRFHNNTEMAAAVGDRHGVYLASFESENAQVTAELFRQGDSLVAFVTFREDLVRSEVSDDYVTPLFQKAAELGFDRRLRIVYAGM
jgi:hypothetical protein